MAGLQIVLFIFHPTLNGGVTKRGYKKRLQKEVTKRDYRNRFSEVSTY